MIFSPINDNVSENSEGVYHPQDITLLFILCIFVSKLNSHPDGYKICKKVSSKIDCSMKRRFKTKIHNPCKIFCVSVCGFVRVFVYISLCKGVFSLEV